MDKTFTQQHTNQQIMLDHLKELGNQKTEEVIYRILHQLKTYYPELPQFPSLSELERAIDESLTEESNVATLLATWNSEIDKKRLPLEEKIKQARAELALAKDSERSNKNKTTTKELSTAKRALSKAESEQYNLSLVHSIRYAMVYARLALKSHHEGKTDKALTYTNEASFSCGEISANSNIELDRLVKDQKYKNGLNRNIAIQKAKDRAIELLKINKPIGGWPSKQKAAASIKIELEEFINKNKLPGITSSNVINTLLKTWSTHDEGIKTALNTALSSNED
ncbi:hypothetical protein IPC75_06290 [Pseudomonas aeruginosa]|uniref:hypothetical protein n=1 Tax=Pseudomonas aeruginosa TaxID=287 RepID=UPI001067FC6B|nr:hypothetical protein [Pseudomonas aeruginosa]TEP24805.1 hypothetical protein IPC78_25080 [Pseudomonas aeruginosa]TEP33722.1 hypothetical protein IPC76_24710 [Pseudomonas aeruginosa]TEP48285.1 hypothetical protein IPC77_10615 [Pseudomonas aeruginosa]TEP48363.1 hypothetical protein IPC75_06290 [Pseudomonas aeruginosa]